MFWRKVHEDAWTVWTSFYVNSQMRYILNFVIHSQSALQNGNIVKFGSLLLTPSLTSAGLSETLAGREKKKHNDAENSSIS